MWRFKSSLRHLETKGLAANNAASPFSFPSPLGKSWGNGWGRTAVTLLDAPGSKARERKEGSTDGGSRTAQQDVPRRLHARPPQVRLLAGHRRLADGRGAAGRRREDAHAHQPGRVGGAR